VTFPPGQGADIQPGQVLRVTGKVNQSGNRRVSIADPTYQVIEVPEES
jgi:archaellum component FlaG (FlaF/FlaG flagellin family)